MTPLRIVIPGGSGQVGTMLPAYFHSRGNAVTVLARRPAETPWRTTVWNDRDVDPTWLREIDGADIVINLAGRSVNCRYNQANRREIMDSRIQTTPVCDNFSNSSKFSYWELLPNSKL
jgi:uncharacterized protein